MSRYTSATDNDCREMLEEIGVGSIDALFEDIPEEMRLGRPLALPDGMPETEVYDRLSALAARNVHAEAETSFLGAGMYDHYVPAIVDAITSRSEFLTPYTPVPARDLPGWPPGDVRVPDRDVGAHRPPRLQRRPLRGALGGGLRCLPGDRRHRAPQAGRLPRPSSPQPRVAGHLRGGLWLRAGRGPARGRDHRCRRPRRGDRRRDRRGLPPATELPRRGRGRRGPG